MSLLFGWCIIAEQMIYWIVHIFILGTLAWLFYRKFHSDLPLWVFTTALVMKLLAGIVVGLIFINYYQQGDTIVFFEKSRVFAALPFKEYLANLFSPSNYLTTGQPRVLFFTKFLSFFTLITGQSYWISSLYLSIISFFSTWYLVITLTKEYRHLDKVFIVCFLFIPTIVFWSSGILKDSLSFSALAYSVAVIIKLHKKRRVLILEWLLSIFAIFLLYKVKHYLLIALILFVGLLVFCTLISRPNLSTKIVATGVMVAALFATQLIHPYLKFSRIALTIYENNKTILAKSDPENRLNIAIDAPTTNGILKAVPAAMQIGLFRPSILDRSTFWGWLHRLENTLLAFLFAFSGILFFKLHPKLDVPLVAAACISILLLATMLALSTPNFGTLVRYKNAFLPFLFMLCSILPYRYLTSKSSAE